MDSLEFLRLVWDHQLGRKKGYAFLSFKDLEGGWRDLGYKYPADELELPDASLGDIYFCPNLFKVCRRREEHMLPSRWLYADLDTVEPRSEGVLEAGGGFPPTIAWESSPGRYQALWLIDEAIKRKKHRELSKHLSYLVGADKGGWDITQVLRVPGTSNHKYVEKPEVRLLWA